MKEKIIFKLDTGFCGCVHTDELKRENYEEKEWNLMVLFTQDGTTGDADKDAELESYFDDIYQNLVLSYIGMTYWAE